MKGEHGTRNTANEEALRAFERLDFIRALTIVPGEACVLPLPRPEYQGVAAGRWADVLELYTYKAQTPAFFHDVISSAVVRWDDVVGHSSVSNEIDVMAARGVIPLFLSCKACDIKTEALNELAILRDRFGGKGAKAVIVTTEPCHSAARHPRRPAGHRRHRFRGAENRAAGPPAEGHHESRIKNNTEGLLTLRIVLFELAGADEGSAAALSGVEEVHAGDGDDAQKVVLAAVKVEKKCAIAHVAVAVVEVEEVDHALLRHAKVGAVAAIVNGQILHILHEVFDVRKAVFAEKRGSSCSYRRRRHLHRAEPLHTNHR